MFSLYQTLSLFHSFSQPSDKSSKEFVEIWSISVQPSVSSGSHFLRLHRLFLFLWSYVFLSPGSFPFPPLQFLSLFPVKYELKVFYGASMRTFSLSARIHDLLIQSNVLVVLYDWQKSRDHESNVNYFNHCLALSNNNCNLKINNFLWHNFLFSIKNTIRNHRHLTIPSNEHFSTSTNGTGALCVSARD